MNPTPPAPPSAAGPPAEAPRRLRLFSKLRVRLLLLVLLSILPALLLVLFNAFEQRRTAQEDARDNALRLARLAAAAQKQHIEASRQLLVTLSQLPEVRRTNALQCEALFNNLLGLHQVYLNFGLINPAGWVVASALAQTNEFLGDRSYFLLARDTGKFTVGEYQIGRITRKALVNMAFPVETPDGRSLAGVVYVALDLKWLNQLAARADLREGSTLTVLDRKGVILLHYGQATEGQDVIGVSLASEAAAKDVLKSGAEGSLLARGPDDVQRLYAFTPLSRTGGLPDAFVIVGMPIEVAYATANRLLAQNLAFLGVVSLLAFVAAWAFGDFFVLRQVRGLVLAAQRMRHGDLTARSGVTYTLGELGELARGFDEMAVALEQRVADLQQTKEELRRLNEELEQRVIERTTELKRSNEDLEQFAYVASHDLLEPLRMITSYMQLLQQRYGPQLDGNANEFIGFALDGGTRMQRLIADLLAYSRVGTRGRPFEQVDLAEIFRRARQNLEVAIQENSAQVTADALPVVPGDPVQLAQLFQNLIANAIKFRGEAPPRVHLRAVREGAGWHVFVRDNGIGISRQDFERIFVIFQRLHHRDKYPGTGIGLSICKKIVERHGGRIWVESSPGHGSTFHFTLAGL